MERWFEFMGNHPILFGILGILMFMLFAIDNKRSGKKMPANQVGTLVNQENAQIIDIRTKKKFDSGYIQGSRNVPFTDLRNRLEELKAIEAPIIVVCDMGIPAGPALQLLDKENAYRLEGGIGGWQAAGLPLVGGKKDNNKKSDNKKTAKKNSDKKD